MDKSTIDEHDAAHRTDGPARHAAAHRAYGAPTENVPGPREREVPGERRFRLYWDPKRRVLLRTR